MRRRRCLRIAGILLGKAAGNAEEGDKRAQVVSLTFHRPGRRRAFLDQGRVLLGHLVHLGDGAVDLIQAVCLFGGGAGDLRHQIGDAADAGDDIGQRSTSGADQFDAVTDLGVAVDDQRLYLLGSLCRALGQRADFLGDHGETAACIAGTGRLDRRR